jgi:hypothetical protein
MTTFSPISSTSQYNDPYPKINDIKQIAADFELEYLHDKFSIKYDNKYFRLNKQDGTIMLSKSKPLYFTKTDNYFITKIKNKQYKLCGCYPHLSLCELDNDTYEDEIIIKND